VRFASRARLYLFPRFPLPPIPIPAHGGPLGPQWCGLERQLWAESQGGPQVDPHAADQAVPACVSFHRTWLLVSISCVPVCPVAPCWLPSACVPRLLEQGFFFLLQSLAAPLHAEVGYTVALLSPSCGSAYPPCCENVRGRFVCGMLDSELEHGSPSTPTTTRFATTRKLWRGR